jgi:hypothetical protein
MVPGTTRNGQLRRFNYLVVAAVVLSWLVVLGFAAFYAHEWPYEPPVVPVSVTAEPEDEGE